MAQGAWRRRSGPVGISEEELHKSFASLSQEEQRYAELFMHDVERGEIELEEGKTLRDYITYYANSAKNSQVEQITKAFDVMGRCSTR